jgi:hypothetical protein
MLRASPTIPQETRHTRLLPPAEEMLIEDLTDEEDRLFVEVILDGMSPAAPGPVVIDIGVL